MKVLKGQDILALGFMTFALFVGRQYHLPAYRRFAVRSACLDGGAGLPDHRRWPAGHHRGRTGQGRWRHGCPEQPDRQVFGGLLAAACYLSVGPLFATPRTATVSFEVGVAPLTGESRWRCSSTAWCTSCVVLAVSMYPGKLLDTVGRFLAPLKIIALAVLGIAAFALPAGDHR
jgi:LIVCS family branched-chain amino acid:cation transporter